jgi:serine/tyrosine/threonine adenylyltransferase
MSFNQLQTNSKLQELGSPFFEDCVPKPLKNPTVLDLNPLMVKDLGLSSSDIKNDEWRDLLNGTLFLGGKTPVASRYSGHQFGIWAGQLGDGRAHILGELNGWELQLKGSGLTPFSRGGDGRAVLRSTIREYLASEYMHALDIPTTRSLGIITSSEPVYRETVEHGASMIRLSPTFVRFGTFEHFSEDLPRLNKLKHWVITHFYPQCKTTEDLFRQITINTATMIAKWMAYGFCHGVMNTDNMSVLGLTLDYGPYGFLETYDPDHICNHSDHEGRYRYKYQPSIAQWNLSALAYALQDDLPADKAELIIGNEFVSVYDETYWTLMCERFGIVSNLESKNVIQEILNRMVQSENLNRWLYQFTWDRDILDEKWNDVISRCEDLSTVETKQKMKTKNPKYVLYNWVAQDVINRVNAGDTEILGKVRSVLQSPFDEHESFGYLAGDIPGWGQCLEVSCSS